jgi:hypothetical protein
MKKLVLGQALAVVLGVLCSCGIPPGTDAPPDPYARLDGIAFADSNLRQAALDSGKTYNYELTELSAGT